jgi:hypothetical protein
MSAAPGIEKTHDVGERISWTLRPAISTKLNLVRLENGDEFDVPEGKPVPKVGDESARPAIPAGSSPATTNSSMTWSTSTTRSSPSPSPPSWRT